MTENRDREISLNTLASKFAEGEVGKVTEWHRTLHEAIVSGMLAARREQHPPVTTQGHYRPSNFATGKQTFVPARTSTPQPRFFVTPAACRTWLAKLPDFNPPGLVLVWMGNAWQSAQAPESAASDKTTQADWETLTPEQRKAAWDGMTKAGRLEKARELVKAHQGNKTRAGAEVGITGNRIGQILKEGEPEEPEPPLPDNHWIRDAGLAEPKRGKASR
jgi:hypothetical protein